MHAMLSIVYDNKLHLAPIGRTPQRILDLGAGSGIWCIEMGDMYPSADLTGVDLSANLPEWVPPNVHFEVDNQLLRILRLEHLTDPLLRLRISKSPGPFLTHSITSTRDTWSAR
jgi:hypothetical protein